MRLLSAVHRWAGGFLGLLLALLGLSGALLVWEGSWVGVPGAGGPVKENVRMIAAVADRAVKAGKVGRITFAGDELALHQISFADGSGAYVRQDGRVVDRWTSEWQRPELWLFDLHHNLLAGKTGETVAGAAGVAGLLFVITGTVLWWRTRRSFVFRLWPARFAPGPIVAHHRNLGILAAPLLLMSMTTGTLMVFDSARAVVLGKEVRPKVPISAAATSPSLAAMLATAKARFPEAELRRISFSARPGGPITVRMRQPSEWTPNGKTQLTFDSRSGALIGVEDGARGNRAAAAAEKLYPVHSAKIGGLALKLLMTASGFILFLLGSLATWSFWVRRSRKRRGREFSGRLVRA